MRLIRPGASSGSTGLCGWGPRWHDQQDGHAGAAGNAMLTACVEGCQLVATKSPCPVRLHARDAQHMTPPIVLAVVCLWQQTVVHLPVVGVGLVFSDFILWIPYTIWIHMEGPVQRRAAGIQSSSAAVAFHASGCVGHHRKGPVILGRGGLANTAHA